MWFTKKRIYKQIEEYILNARQARSGEKDILLEFANYLLVMDACDVTLEHLKDFYTGRVRLMNSDWQRCETMLVIRKFFRHLTIRGECCLKPRQILDNPLQSVESCVIIQPMETQKKPLRRNTKGMEKVRILREEGELSFREIARAMKKDVRQVYLWHKYNQEKVK